MEAKMIWWPPQESEQTHQQKALTDPVVQEIVATGDSVEYGERIARMDVLNVGYLRQQLSSEEESELQALRGQFDSLFGRYGVHFIFVTYDFHPTRIEETKRIERETEAIMDSLPPRCRLPRRSTPY